MQNHLPKTEDLMLQNATPLRKSAPSPPNISDEHVSCTAPATENASLQILFKCPNPHVLLAFAISKTKCTKHTSVGPLLEVEMSKKCTLLWREAHFQQNVQNTPGSDHFWKLRCRKSARRCGAKHISKSKCTKHTRFGPLLVAKMSKKCTPL